METMDMAGKYVDGFVVPVPKDSIQAYKTFSEKAGESGRSTALLNTSSALLTT
jgi:uncharacterized protein YbaA (DUF1428 family)